MTRKSLFISFTFLLISLASFAQTPPLLSPEVHSDNRVTFRFRAPNVKEMAVRLEGVPKPIPMQKDDLGVWTLTTEPLTPDYYGYTFIADSANMFDRSNPAIRFNFLYTVNELHVPGPLSLPWEIANVPHGEIHHHFYRSSVVSDDRDFFVYTPPG